MEPKTGSGSRMARLSAILLVALLTASCATAGSKKEKIKETFKISLEAFNGDIRWQDFESAAAFIPTGQKQLYWKQMDRMKHDIRLTDFEVRGVEFSDLDRSARAVVHFQYWRLDSPILRDVTLTQRWRYQGKRKGMWKITDTGFSAIMERK